MADDRQSESEMSKWSPTKKLLNNLFLPNNDIQERLQSLILGTRESWTHAIFWELFLYSSNWQLSFSSKPKDPPQSLVWGAGYFKGDEPNNQITPRSAAEQMKLRRAIGVTDEETDEFMTDSEWFCFISAFESFDDGNRLPQRAFFTSTVVWVTGAQRLSSVDCRRAHEAELLGIQTMVYVPLVNGVIELGSSSLIFPYAEFDLLNRIRALFKIKNNFSIQEIGTDSAGSDSIPRQIQPQNESESSVGNQPMIQQGNIISQRDNNKTRDSESSDDRDIEKFTKILRRLRR